MAHDPNNSLIDNVGEEVKGMAKDGINHPSTKPVLTGAAVGAVAGFLLPVLTIPVGLIGGAAFMLYQRAKR